MKRSKFTNSQIMEALKRVDSGLEVPEICREVTVWPTHIALNH